MGNRKKRLIKQIQGLKEQAKKHELKIKTRDGRKDTTLDYWKKEAERLKEQAKEREEILKRLEKNKEEEKK